MDQARATVEYLPPPTEVFRILQESGDRIPIFRSEGVIACGQPRASARKNTTVQDLEGLLSKFEGCKSSPLSRSCVYAYRRFRVTTNKLSGIAGNMVDYIPYEQALCGSGNLSDLEPNMNQQIWTYGHRRQPHRPTDGRQSLQIKNSTHHRRLQKAVTDLKAILLGDFVLLMESLGYETKLDVIKQRWRLVGWVVSAHILCHLHGPIEIPISSSH
ncbi:uncharacterized protein BDZ83DRAFT_654076 [Colletotrichum acutatum]|uniref:Uncharacterized protein n=1 Tax=Glomerella acutata TaxID=27357 RepID=A0AAD8XEZ0_GLOAC|nr:uncharacterized protein BDZ83DRAFT_654076 [Colletotrichum acutatum]KAK1722263.1 hypothetical protein BDZ83DRAFT_654076 [Colletotrichum acutatum]